MPMKIINIGSITEDKLLVAIETSDSKNRASSFKISLNEPVSSPTAIISVTTGGKSWGYFAKREDRVFPFSISATVSATIFL